MKKRFMVVPAVGYFCLTLLFAWLGIAPKGGIPPTLTPWLIAMGAAAVETAIFTILLYVVLSKLAKHREAARHLGTGPPPTRSS